jgi:hypothetical protein
MSAAERVFGIFELAERILELTVHIDSSARIERSSSVDWRSHQRSLKDLILWRLVCRNWNSIINSSPILRFHLYLAAHMNGEIPKHGNPLLIAAPQSRPFCIRDLKYQYYEDVLDMRIAFAIAYSALELAGVSTRVYDSWLGDNPELFTLLWSPESGWRSMQLRFGKEAMRIWMLFPQKEEGQATSSSQEPELLLGVTLLRSPWHDGFTPNLIIEALSRKVQKDTIYQYPKGDSVEHGLRETCSRILEFYRHDGLFPEMNKEQVPIWAMAWDKW